MRSFSVSKHPFQAFKLFNNNLYTHQSLQQKHQHHIGLVTFPQLWSTSPLPRSQSTPECPYVCEGLYTGHLKNEMIFNDCYQNKMIFSPKRSTLLLKVTTRNPHIGLGRSPPGTSLHSPAEGWYTSVEARRSFLESRPPVTRNTWILLKECFIKNKLNFTLSLSWFRKLEHPWLNRPVLSLELKSSIHPCFPYRDTVVRVKVPPVNSTVSVSGSGIEHANL